MSRPNQECYILFFFFYICIYQASSQPAASQAAASSQPARQPARLIRMPTRMIVLNIMITLLVYIRGLPKWGVCCLESEYSRANIIRLAKPFEVCSLFGMLESLTSGRFLRSKITINFLSGRVNCSHNLWKELLASVASARLAKLRCSFHDSGLPWDTSDYLGKNMGGGMQGWESVF